MLHQMKYSFRQMIRDTTVMFWALCFPIILGTLFYFAFGSAVENSKQELIPVAVVVEHEDASTNAFLEFLDALDQETLLIERSSKEKAVSALREEKINGIYYVGEEINLTVAQSGLQESILATLLENYKYNADMVTNIATTHPENKQKAMEEMQAYTNMTKEVSLGGNTYDYTVIYFFALIAMACLYGCFLGMKTSLEVKANITALAARRSVSPTHRLQLVIGDMIVVFTVHFINIFILLVYLQYVLGVDFGDVKLPIIAICLVGSMFGVAFGIAIGSIGRLSEKAKIGIMLGGSMISSFLSGLMLGEIKYQIEKVAPIINRINPATLISDAFYAITVYDDMERYYRNLGTLVLMSTCLIFISFLAVRRERYDSI